MKQILIVSSGLVHPPLLGRRRLRAAVAALPGYHVRSIGSMEMLATLSLPRFRALVLYFHRQRISERAGEIFERFVREGGGVLALHSATASFKGSPRFAAVLGGRFTGHGPVQAFALQPVDGDAGPFAGMEPFTVTDELYRHELEPDITVHFTAGHKGEAVPVVWTRRHGRGRVCYVGPGHRAATLAQPAMQRLLARGLEWVCG